MSSSMSHRLRDNIAFGLLGTTIYTNSNKGDWNTLWRLQDMNWIVVNSLMWLSNAFFKALSSCSTDKDFLTTMKTASTNYYVVMVTGVAVYGLSKKTSKDLTNEYLETIFGNPETRYSMTWILQRIWDELFSPHIHFTDSSNVVGDGRLDFTCFVVHRDMNGDRLAIRVSISPTILSKCLEMYNKNSTLPGFIVACGQLIHNDIIRVLTHDDVKTVFSNVPLIVPTPIVALSVDPPSSLSAKSSNDDEDPFVPTPKVALSVNPSNDDEDPFDKTESGTDESDGSSGDENDNSYDESSESEQD